MFAPYPSVWYPEWDLWIIGHFTDPILKRLAINPVYCPNGHVNEAGIVELGEHIAGSARCNHLGCRATIADMRVNAFASTYIRNWMAFRGPLYLSYNIQELKMEIIKVLDSLHRRNCNRCFHVNHIRIVRNPMAGEFASNLFIMFFVARIIISMIATILHLSS